MLKKAKGSGFRSAKRTKHRKVQRGDIFFGGLAEHIDALRSPAVDALRGHARNLNRYHSQQLFASSRVQFPIRIPSSRCRTAPSRAFSVLRLSTWRLALAQDLVLFIQLPVTERAWGGVAHIVYSRSLTTLVWMQRVEL